LRWHCYRDWRFARGSYAGASYIYPASPGHSRKPWKVIDLDARAGDAEVKQQGLEPDDHRAWALEPNYAPAHARLALCHEIFFEGAGLDEANKTAGLRHARVVITSGTDDATALAIAALVITLLSKDHQVALSAIERALSLNPSCATTLYFGALIYAFVGHLAAATANANRALRLSPFDPGVF
jgi:tetratricopeptide (TPR) repeat protein